MLSSVLGGIEIRIAYAAATGTVVPVCVKALAIGCPLLKVSLVHDPFNVVVTERRAILEGAAIDISTAAAVIINSTVKTVCTALDKVAGGDLLIVYVGVRNRHRTNGYRN